MSKITRDAATAFWHSRPFCSGNTQVMTSLSSIGARMYLHNHEIAAFSNGHLLITSAGWKTKTTKDRLNGILERFGYPARITQKGGKWFLGDHEWVNPGHPIGIVI